MFSYHFCSRVDIGLAGGGRFDCENLRAGCAGMVPTSQDGGPAGSYSVIATDTSP